MSAIKYTQYQDEKSGEYQDEKSQALDTRPALQPLSYQGTTALKSTTALRKSFRASQISPASPVLFQYKPVVLPRIHSAGRSPFARAYAPSLSAHDISKEQWLGFVDGLNRHTTRSSVASAVTVTGGVIAAFPTPFTVLGGGLIMLVSESSDVARSKLMSKHYLHKANKQMFAPKGLVVKIYETRRALKTLDVPQLDGVHPDELSAMARRDSQLSSRDKPSARMEKALKPFGHHCAPLEFYDDANTTAGVLGRIDGYSSKSQARIVAKKQKRAARKLLAAQQGGSQKKIDKRLRQYAATQGESVAGQPAQKRGTTVSTQWLVVTQLRGTEVPAEDKLIVEIDEDDTGSMIEQMSLVSVQSALPAYELRSANV